MGITKRFCKHGHDTHVVGRRPSNSQCRVCYRKKDTEYHIRSGQVSGTYAYNSRHGIGIAGERKRRRQREWVRKNWISVETSNLKYNAKRREAKLAELSL